MHSSIFSSSISLLASKRPSTQLTGLVQLIRLETGLEAVQINALDLRAGSYRELTQTGYEPSVAEFYQSRRFIRRCIGFRLQLQRSDDLLSWGDVPGFLESHTASAILRPSGFANGMSVPIKDRAGIIVGVCNVNTTRDHVTNATKQLIGELRPTIASLISSVVRETAPDLSPRELDVLRLLASGRSNREIAVHLTIATRTVSTHVEHILSKLGVSSRVQAATYAVAGGIIEDF